MFEVSPTQVRDQTKTVLRMVTEQNIAIAYSTVFGNTYVNLIYTLENSRNEGNPYFGINFASIFPLILSQFWHFCVAFDVFCRFWGLFLTINSRTATLICRLISESLTKTTLCYNTKTQSE